MYGLVEERKRLGAKGNALLLSQGYGVQKGWWRPKSWAALSQQVADWVLEMLKVWVAVLRQLDEQILQAKIGLANRAKAKGCSLRAGLSLDNLNCPVPAPGGAFPLAGLRNLVVYYSKLSSSLKTYEACSPISRLYSYFSSTAVAGSETRIATRLGC